MTPKEAQDFHKEVLKKRNSGYMRIVIGYKEYLLPHAAGVQMLQAMEHAEILDTGYSNTPYKVLPMQDEISFKPISDETYAAMKLSHFMSIPYDAALEIMTKRQT